MQNAMQKILAANWNSRSGVRFKALWHINPYIFFVCFGCAKDLEQQSAMCWYDGARARKHDLGRRHVVVKLTHIRDEIQFFSSFSHSLVCLDFIVMNEILFFFFFLVGLYHEDFSRIAQNQIRNRRELDTCVGEKRGSNFCGKTEKILGTEPTILRNCERLSSQICTWDSSNYVISNLQLRCTFHSINFTIYAH